MQMNAPLAGVSAPLAGMAIRGRRRQRVQHSDHDRFHNITYFS
jgi:hypothetical protein